MSEMTLFELSEYMEGQDCETKDCETKESDEYYTPKYVVDVVRTVLGEIDLDPTSNEIAQRVINAAKYFTTNDDCLSKAWIGKVWLNPPYSRPQPFIDKLISEYDKCNVTDAIVLVNNGTETRWGQTLLNRFSVCFPDHRISFWKTDPDRPEKGNRYAQMIFYLGPNTDGFYSNFSCFGPILTKRKEQEVSTCRTAIF